MTKKQKEITVSLILFLVAITILAISGRTAAVPTTAAALMLDLLSKFAFALLVAVVIRSTLVFLYGEGEEFDKFLALGMSQVHDPLHDKNLQGRLAGAQDIRVLKTWFPETEDIETGLRRAITDNKATVKLLLCKPDSILLRQRSIDALKRHRRAGNAVYEAIENIDHWLKAKPDDKVEIVLYDSWPGCPVIWYDKTILMGFYFRGAPSTFWPWISVKEGSRLATILEDQFNELWDQLWDPPNRVHLKNHEERKKWLEENEQWSRLGAKYGEEAASPKQDAKS